MDFFIFGKTFSDLGLFRKIKNLGLAPVTHNSKKENGDEGHDSIIIGERAGDFPSHCPGEQVSRSLFR